MTTAAHIPFQIVDWQHIQKTIHAGEKGWASWQTIQLGAIRLRLVNYSAGYLADHWCAKGHIVHCLEGELVSELATGERFLLTPGMSYVVSDGASLHRSVTEKVVTLLIIDGDFLKPAD